MKSEEERDYERKRRDTEKMMELFTQLTPWHKVEFMVYLYWLAAKERITNLPLSWIEFLLEMERQFQIHGMPFMMRLQLEKWFNYPPHDEDKYFLIQGKKIWYHCFAAEDNFELHLYHKGHYPGTIWFQPEMDGSATIIGIDIREEYRNCGLGTVAFWEAVNQIKDRVSSLKGLLEIEYYPEPEDSLRWLHGQGFITKQKENGDYEIELKIK